MMRYLLPSLLLSALGVALVACGGSSPSTPSPGSGGSLATSHNAGRDCTGCHNFTLAGTVYKPDGTTVYPGVLIKVTTAAGGSGTTIATLTSDGSGNFYTGASVNFASGAYVTASGTSGTVSAMTAALTRGGCNGCHVSGNRVVAQ